MPKSFEELREPYDNQITKEEYLKIAERRIREFDFEKIHSVMTFLDWKWSKGDKREIPTVEELRKECKRLIKEAVEYDMINLSCGGFTIHRLRNDVRIEFCMSPQLEDVQKDNSDMLNSCISYIEQLQEANVKNTEVISSLISALCQTNERLAEAAEKIKTSRLSNLWSRYFKEVDSGNPRECVLNSLVELIKLERQDASIKVKKSARYQFLVRHCKNGEFEFYCNKKYLTKTDSLEKANELLMRHINDAKITNHVIYDYYEESCKQKFRR